MEKILTWADFVPQLHCSRRRIKAQSLFTALRNHFGKNRRGQKRLGRDTVVIVALARFGYFIEMVCLCCDLGVFKRRRRRRDARARRWGYKILERHDYHKLTFFKNSSSARVCLRFPHQRSLVARVHLRTWKAPRTNRRIHNSERWVNSLFIELAEASLSLNVHYLKGMCDDCFRRLTFLHFITSH